MISGHTKIVLPYNQLVGDSSECTARPDTEPPTSDESKSFNATLPNTVLDVTNIPSEAALELAQPLEEPIRRLQGLKKKTTGEELLPLLVDHVKAKV
jgi:hypothetical protein